MRRRTFTALIGGALISRPVQLLAQNTNSPVIGFLSGASPDSFAHLVAAFHEGLRATGFVEGDNVSVEYRWAEGDYDRLPSLAADLVDRAVDVIVASGGDRPTLAAKALTTRIPIVFAGSDAPVRFGLVESLSRPGGNITGASLFTSELEIKKFELLHEVVPSASLVAMLVNPNNPMGESDARDIMDATRAMGIGLYLTEARSADEIDAAFNLLAEQPIGGLLIGHDPFFNSQREQIVALATELGVPAVYEHREFVLVGGLMSYGNLIDDNYRVAGDYTGRILKGASPAELPVRQATKFELVLNLRTAASLGLEFPTSVLIRADNVIE